MRFPSGSAMKRTLHCLTLSSPPPYIIPVVQNFEELINPEVPSAMMLSPEKVSMPDNWNTIRSKKGGLNLAGKMNDVE